MELSINKETRLINEIKQDLKFINSKKKPWQEKEYLENRIISVIKENPSILTQKSQYLFTNLLFADYIIEKGNEKIIKGVIDANPELLTKSYKDFINNIYENTTASPLSEYQKYSTAYIIAIKACSLIPYMLEKNKDIIKDTNFLRHAVIFGLDDTKKYLIDNFIQDICTVDPTDGEPFAHKLIKSAHSQEIIKHLKETIQKEVPEAMKLKDERFISVKTLLNGFLRE
jgi:hypothetical protein